MRAALEDKSKIPLTAIALPMLVENIIRSSLLLVDQLMLNRYSEKAAAAMSSVNQFSYFIQLLYLLVAAGPSARCRSIPASQRPARG